MKTGHYAFFLTALSLAGLLAWGALARGEEIEAPASAATRVEDHLPARVRDLFFRWDEAGLGRRLTQAAVDKDRNLRYAGSTGVTWMKMIINSDWLPDEKALRDGLVMVQDQFGAVDVAHAQWLTHGYRVRVSQTQTVMAISIVRPGRTMGWETLEAKAIGVAALCARIIRDVTKDKLHIPPGGTSAEELAPDGTLRVLLNAAFVDGRIEECENGVVGLPRHPANLPDLLAFERSQYWWARMGWWTDGNTVGLFTIKTQGGQAVAVYDAKSDEYWFEGSPYVNKRGDLKESSEP